jgi:dTDP-4-dehydrorhamnose reductase
MRVVVLGSIGQLGQDLMRIFGDAAVGLTHQDGDITNTDWVRSIITSLRPDWVLNTAAFHRVDDCEADPTRAFAVNAVGALNVARAAEAVGSGVVFFSTDYVFSGERRTRGHPYVEDDRPQPASVYGVSKLAGEQSVMFANPRHLIIRTTGLFGLATSRKGWTFPELMITKARSAGVVRVVTDQVVAPTFTADLASCVRDLVSRDVTGLFHVTNTGECSWYEFARRVLKFARIDATVEPTLTVRSQTGARRPPYSALASTCLVESGARQMRPWEDALREYLSLKGLIPHTPVAGEG